jgi:hypothetical protein
MSDAPQGPGWWQASDDKWYPPPRPEMPGEEAATQPVTTSPPGAVPSGGYPQQPPTTPYGTGPPMAGSPVGGTPPPGATPSPYGMPPPGPPPGGGDNRTPLFVALGVLGAAAFVGLLLVVMSNDDDGGGPSPSSSTTIDTTETTGGTEPPDTEPSGPQGPPADGELAINEQNFTVSFDQLSDQDTLSYGFIVENTTDQVAVGVNAAIAFKDEAGTVIGSDEELVNVIRPGATFGIGDSGIEVDGDAVDMEVTISEPTSWESADSYGEITVSGINTTIDDYGAPTTAFTAESTYEEQLDSPYAYVIYRNASGDIVGGAWSTMQFLQPNGSTTGEVSALYTIEDIDDTKTEVFVDAGFFS